MHIIEHTLPLEPFEVFAFNQTSFIKIKTSIFIYERLAIIKTHSVRFFLKISENVTESYVFPSFFLQLMTDQNF